MSFRITVIPASTQAGKETIRALLEDKRQPSVQAVYRNSSKAPSEFISHPKFTALQGDVSGDSKFDFSESDAVFYIPPPTYNGTGTAEFATRAATKVKAALQAASNVKRLLIFSAIGAQHEENIVGSD